MWLWAVLWHASTLLLVGGTFDYRFFTRQRVMQPAPAQVNYCYEVPKMYTTGLRFPRHVNQMFSSPTVLSRPLINFNVMSSRVDRLLPEADDIVKQHAKLVQDINSLKQYVFVPFADENKDYEDSIFHEIIETTTATTQKTTTKPAVKTKTSPIPATSSIPIILLGGSSNTRQVVKSQPIKFPKTSISLVGTTVSPLLRHPYPFVMQGSVPKPMRVCMPTLMSSYPTTTRRPSLWERLLNSIIPR